MGVRLLGGLNILGAVGLRKGALGIPLRGAGTQHSSVSHGADPRGSKLMKRSDSLVVSIFLTKPLPLA